MGCACGEFAHGRGGSCILGAVSDHDPSKYSADISQDVIQEALKSVERQNAPLEGDASAELASLREQLEFSQTKGRETLERLKEEHERLLRTTADLENVRKRSAKEREEAQKFGAERLLKDLLPVLDNLDRALEHAKAEPTGALRQGVEMTRKLFEDVLGKHGVKGVESVGKPFDPRFHEAIQQEARADLPPGQVVNEVVRGFTLNDRLVRPALVVVSKAPDVTPGGGSEA